MTARTDYGDVPEMFRHLSTLEEGSIAFARQRDSIVERCLPLAANIARRFRNRGEPLEDLVQVAFVGLMNAVNRFDPDSGSDFLAFAVPTIMGEVRRHFRDYGWSVKVPRRFKELNGRLRNARAELSQQLGRAPTAGELAGHVGIDREEVVQAEIAFSAYSTLSADSLGSGSGDDDGGPAIKNSFGDLDANLDKVLDAETIRVLLAALPQREQTVIMLRFFGDMTQSQIAQRLGISQMHVSRLLSRALTALRGKVRIPELV